MRFAAGMICCNPWRAQAGMGCSDDQKFYCACDELGRLAKRVPDAIPDYLQKLFEIFPLVTLYVPCRQAKVVDAWIAAAANVCAQIPTREERREFVELLTPHITADEMKQFHEIHDAEWRRLRNK
jgi:hypothetical protein